MRTPPMRGLMAFKTSAVFIKSWPTMAANGKFTRMHATI